MLPLSAEEWMAKKVFFVTKSEMVQPHGVEVNEEEESTRETMLKQVWASHITEEFDLTHLIQTEAQFSHAIAVVDRIGGWIEEGRNGDGGSQE